MPAETALARCCGSRLLPSSAWMCIVTIIINSLIHCLPQPVRLPGYVMYSNYANDMAIIETAHLRNKTAE